MKNKVHWIKIAESDDNVTLISSQWCYNRNGICLSFAVSIPVLTIDQINDLSKQFMKEIKKSYTNLLHDYFYAKMETPIITATDEGELIMMWSFQGDNDNKTKEAIKQFNIKEVQYE